jgi:hypothetical protein
MPEPSAVDRLYQECCERLCGPQADESRGAAPSRGFGVPHELFADPVLNWFVWTVLSGSVGGLSGALARSLWDRVRGHVSPQDMLRKIETGMQEMRDQGAVSDELRSEMQAAVAQMKAFVQEALNGLKERPSAEQIASAQEGARTILEEAGFPTEKAAKLAKEMTESVVNRLGQSAR